MLTGRGVNRVRDGIIIAGNCSERSSINLQLN